MRIASHQRRRPQKLLGVDQLVGGFSRRGRFHGAPRGLRRRGMAARRSQRLRALQRLFNGQFGQGLKHRAGRSFHNFEPRNGAPPAVGGSRPAGGPATGQRILHEHAIRPDGARRSHQFLSDDSVAPGSARNFRILQRLGGATCAMAHRSWRRGIPRDRGLIRRSRHLRRGRAQKRNARRASLIHGAHRFVSIRVSK